MASENQFTDELDFDQDLPPTTGGTWAFPNDASCDRSQPSVVKSVWKQIEPPNRLPDTDLREKLKQNKWTVDDDSESFPTPCESPRRDRREGRSNDRTPQSQRDLRNRIRNRRGTREHRDQEDRPNYRSGPGGLSPLRSPRSHRYNVMDMDNSHSYRFTRSYPRSSEKERRCRGHRSSGSSSPSDKDTRGRGRRSNDSSPSNRHTDSTSDDGLFSPIRSTTVLAEADEEGTPILSNPLLSPIGHGKKTWSRRRLQLPSENGESDNEYDEEDSSTMPTIQEEDPARLARREKDIQYGKNTDAYRHYVEQVPREKRSFDKAVHPRTPQKLGVFSRRSWDAQVKIWRRRLHMWEGETNENTPPEDKEDPITELRNHQEEDGESLKKEEKEDEDALELDEKEDQDDDDSFLEDLELNLSTTCLDSDPPTTATVN